MKTTVHISTSCSDRLSDYVRSIPSDFDKRGTPVHSGRNVLRKDTVNGSSIIIKKFGKANIFSKIGTAFKGSKAKRSFDNAAELIKRGITTPAPLAYIDIASPLGFSKTSYYICEFNNDEPISAALGTNAEPNFDFIRRFADFASLIHSKGVIHNDLNNSNVRFSKKEDGSLDFSLIDLNRMRIYNRPLSNRKKFNDLPRFTTFGTIFAVFAEEYAAASGLDKFALHDIFKAKLKHENFAKRKNALKKIFKRRL